MNSSSPAVRVAVALAGIGLLAVIATTLAQGSVRNAAIGVAFALSPGLIWLALRYPLVFPFGLYLALVPFDPLLQTSGGGGTFTKFAGIISIGALLLRTLVVRKAAVPERSWFAWLGVMLYVTATLAWSINYEQTRFQVNTFFSLFALFTALSIFPIRYFELRWVRRMLIFSGIATACYGIYAYRTGQHTVAHVGSNLARLTITSGKVQFDPNHYAAAFMIAIAIVVVGFLFDSRPLFKLAYGAAAALMVANVLLTGSRGGLLAAGIMIVYIGIRARKYATAGAIVAGALALSALIPNVWARFNDAGQGDGSGRNEIWTTGLRAVREYWLLGSGFNTYADAYDNYLLKSAQRVFVGWHRPSHSIIAEAAVEFGLVGSIFLGYALWSTFRANASIARTHPLFTYRLAAEGMFVGILVMALTIDVLWYKYFWIATSFAVLVANVSRSRSVAGNGGSSPTRRPSVETLHGALETGRPASPIARL